MKTRQFFMILVAIAMVLVLAACGNNAVTTGTPTTESTTATPTVYDVTFVDVDVAIPTQEIAEGGKAVAPADPIREGFTFVGWYNGETAFSFDTAITADITLTAKWTAVVKKYNVTFTEVDTAIPTQEIEEGGVATRPSDPVRAGFKFEGWYNGETAFSFDTAITADIALAAKWTAVVKYTVNFTGTDETIPAQEIEEGGVATRPSNPVRAGFKFEGWYIEDTKFQFTTTITAAITLTAKWSEATYFVTFYDKDGTTIVSSEEYAYNATAAAPVLSLTDEELLQGWFTEKNGAGEAYDATAGVTKDLDYYPNIVAAITLRFFDEDKITPIKREKLLVGTKLDTPPSIDKSSVNKDFVGYFTENDAAYDENTAYTASTSFYAKYIQYYQVKFMVGTEEKSSLRVKSGETVIAPTMPDSDEDGRAFLGWFDNKGNEFAPAATVTADAVYIAKYEPKDCTLTFVLPNGEPVMRGTEAFVLTVKEGETAMLPVYSDPLYDDCFYTFENQGELYNIQGSKTITLTPFPKGTYANKDWPLTTGSQAFDEVVTTNSFIKGWGTIMNAVGGKIEITGFLAGPVAMDLTTTTGGNEIQGTITVAVYVDDVQVNLLTLYDGFYLDRSQFNLCTIAQPGKHTVSVEIIEIDDPLAVEKSGAMTYDSNFRGALGASVNINLMPEVKDCTISFVLADGTPVMRGTEPFTLTAKTGESATMPPVDDILYTDCYYALPTADVLCNITGDRVVTLTPVAKESYPIKVIQTKTGGGDENDALIADLIAYPEGTIFPRAWGYIMNGEGDYFTLSGNLAGPFSIQMNPTAGGNEITGSITVNVYLDDTLVSVYTLKDGDTISHETMTVCTVTAPGDHVIKVQIADITDDAATGTEGAQTFPDGYKGLQVSTLSVGVGQALQNCTLTFVLEDGTPVLRNGEPYTLTVKAGETAEMPVAGDALYNDYYYGLKVADALYNVTESKNVILVPVERSAYNKTDIVAKSKTGTANNPSDPNFTTYVSYTPEASALKAHGLILDGEGDFFTITGNFAGPVSINMSITDNGNTSGTNFVKGTIFVHIYVDDVLVNKLEVKNGKSYSYTHDTVCMLTAAGNHTIKVQIAELIDGDATGEVGSRSFNNAWKGLHINMLTVNIAE